MPARKMSSCFRSLMERRKKLAIQSSGIDISVGKLFTDCSVKCLQSIEDLKTHCVKLGLVFNEGKVYEVDFLITDKIENGRKYYYVKWKDCDLEECSWEPQEHFNQKGILISYYESLKSDILNGKMVHHFVDELIHRKPYDVLTLKKVYEFIEAMMVEATHESIESGCHELSLPKLKATAKKLLNLPFCDIYLKKNKLLPIMQFSELRKEILINLKEWEIDMNSFNPFTYISVENNVDLEKAPTNFQFISDYMYTDVQLPPKAAAVFCSCRNCYDSKTSCCPKSFDSAFPYTRNGRLRLMPGYPIFECNDFCKCGPECSNRVVQHGPKIKFAIFRTSNSRGWGLKTLEEIDENQFVLEYLGEIITSENADQRSLVYDFNRKTYLFDLHYDIKECKYTVDAHLNGNASHFINHSCNPNLAAYGVWINQQNPFLPRLALFASRKIALGEELTFDYQISKKGGKDQKNGFKKTRCLCQSKNCRKFI